MNSPGSDDSNCQSTRRWSQARSDAFVGCARRAALLVAPVGGDAALGPLVHLQGADLDLDRFALRPHHRRVQRLVEVELGHGDVVLEPPGDRVPQRVDGPERPVAVLHRVDDDPDAHQVVDLVELTALDDHLLVDRPVVLRPPGHLGVDVEVGQALADVGHDLLEVEAPFGRPGGHHLLDLGVALGVQDGEGEVLQLPLHLRDAEAVRQRRVDVERLLGDAVLLRLGQRRQRPHVVQPVGELDEQDPDVLGHGHEQLLQRGGLLGLLGLELEPVELGDAVDDVGDLVAEVAAYVLQGDRRVLDDVVQQRGGQRHVVEAELGEDRGHRDRVADVGLARLADLAAVAVVRQREGLLDQLGAGARVVAAKARQQLAELAVDEGARPRLRHLGVARGRLDGGGVDRGQRGVEGRRVHPAPLRGPR